MDQKQIDDKKKYHGIPDEILDGIFAKENDNEKAVSSIVCDGIKNKATVTKENDKNLPPNFSFHKKT